MKNKLIANILSWRDFFSSLSGIIISGYLVRISLLTEKNIFHYITMILTLILGFLFFYLIELCKIFEKNKSIEESNGSIREDAIKTALTTVLDDKKHVLSIKIVIPMILLLISFITFCIFKSNNLLTQSMRYDKESLLLKINNSIKVNSDRLISKNKQNQTLLIKKIEYLETKIEKTTTSN